MQASQGALAATFSSPLWREVESEFAECRGFRQGLGGRVAVSVAAGGAEGPGLPQRRSLLGPCGRPRPWRHCGAARAPPSPPYWRCRTCLCTKWRRPRPRRVGAERGKAEVGAEGKFSFSAEPFSVFGSPSDSVGGETVSCRLKAGWAFLQLLSPLLPEECCKMACWPECQLSSREPAGPERRVGVTLRERCGLQDFLSRRDRCWK